MREPAPRGVARQPARAAGADPARPRCRVCSCCRTGGDEPSGKPQLAGTVLVIAGGGRRRACCRAPCSRCPASSSAYGRYTATRVGQAESDLHRRGLERDRRRHAAARRRPQLPQRRQGAGVERAAGHAPAAHARPPDDAHPEAGRRRSSSSAAAPASRRARCRSIRRSSDQTIAEIEPLVPQVVVEVLRRAQLPRRRRTRRCTSRSTTRGTSC